MGIFDVHARSWQAPSREEQLHKKELHALGEAEERKRRQMKNELDTLRKVEHLQEESKEDARHLLEANARDAARRRAISGLNDREALFLAQREHNTARLRNVAAHPQVQLSPNMAMLGSPTLSTSGSVPTINVPSSPGLLGSGLNVDPVAMPRMRTVSAHHPRPTPGLAVFPTVGASPIPQTVYHGSPALGLPLPRPRAVSSVGLGTPVTAERLRLEERKRNLMQKEAELQANREHRLRQKSNRLDLEAQELALRKRAQELAAKATLDSRERFLDNQEAQLNRRQEQLLEAEMAERLRQLSVNTPSLNPLHTSPALGHTRHLSTPGFSSQSPHVNGLSSQYNPALLSEPLLDGGLHPHPGYPDGRHQRAASIGQSPLLGTHALDPGMAGEAARLGILPDGLGIGDLGASQNARAAAYARAGVSPRFGPIQPDLTASYGLGSTGYNTIQDLGLDDLGRLDGYSRSRRGSLSRPDGFDLDGGHLDPGYDAPIGSRLRRDSLPFQY